MASRSNKKKKSKSPVLPPKTTEYDNKIMHLDQLREISLSHSKGSSEALNDLFAKQAEKLQDQMNKLKG
jgi:hypothetical protein